MSVQLKKPKTTAVTRHTAKNGGEVEGPTLLKIQEAAKMISEGKTRDTIIAHLQEKYGMSFATARNFYTDGVRFLLPRSEAKYRNELIAANIARLEKIIEKAMDANQLKVARDAIETLNKMIGIGNGGFQIAVNQDPENKTQQIYIKFD